MHQTVRDSVCVCVKPQKMSSVCIEQYQPDKKKGGKKMMESKKQKKRRCLEDERPYEKKKKKKKGLFWMCCKVENKTKKIAANSECNFL